VTTPPETVGPSALPGSLPRELVARSGFLLIRLGMEFKSRAMAALTKDGVSQYHYSVLALLDEQPSETQAAIADALGLDRSQLVRILDGLEDRGLIARHRDRIDRRRHMVSVTEDGRRQLGELRRTIDRLEAELLEPLAPADRKTLHDLLLQLANFHDPLCAGGPPSG
jgi:MarR family transcriptional regulator, lower aerobic nicotinate degradation pathway regulator